MNFKGFPLTPGKQYIYFTVSSCLGGSHVQWRPIRRHVPDLKPQHCISLTCNPHCRVLVTQKKSLDNCKNWLKTGLRVFGFQHPYFKQGSWRGLHRYRNRAQIFKSSLHLRVPIAHICLPTWDAEISICENLVFKSSLTADAKFVPKRPNLRNSSISQGELSTFNS